MNTVKFPALIACAALAACANLTGNPDNNDALMAHITESEREQVNQSRAALDEASDNLARASQDVVLANAELDLAHSDLDLIKARVEQAEAAVVVAENGTEEELEQARSELLDAQARELPQKDLIDWHKCEVARCKKAETLAEREVDLAEGNVGLVKARAFAGSGQAGSSAVDVAGHEARVRNLEEKVALAAVELDAAARECEVARSNYERVSSVQRSQ